MRVNVLCAKIAGLVTWGRLSSGVWLHVQWFGISYFIVINGYRKVKWDRFLSSGEILYYIVFEAETNNTYRAVVTAQAYGRRSSYRDIGIFKNSNGELNIRCRYKRQLALRHCKLADLGAIIIIDVHNRAVVFGAANCRSDHIRGICRCNMTRQADLCNIKAFVGVRHKSATCRDA